MPKKGLVKEVVKDKRGNERIVHKRPEGHLGITRELMPQIENASDFRRHLTAHGVKTTTKRLDASVVKPAQYEADQKKIDKLIGDYSNWKNQKIIIANDNRLIDGMHRLMAAKQMGKKLYALVVDLPFKQAYTTARNYTSKRSKL